VKYCQPFGAALRDSRFFIDTRLTFVASLHFARHDQEPTGGQVGPRVTLNVSMDSEDLLGLYTKPPGPRM
jgi:hypothetical protein